MELKNRIAIITGGASGIGKSLAERFCSEGARHVVVVDRNGEAAAGVAEAIGGSAAVLDVSDESALRELVIRTEREQGPVDIFVSNAGYVSAGGLEEPNEALQGMWEVHVLSHVYAARAVLPGMIARGEGYLVNTASAAGLLAQIGSLAYSVTKHAAVSLAEWLQITHGDQGIRVSVLCPQAVETNIGANSPKSARSRTLPSIASGDGELQPEQVAQCVIDAMREERFWVLPHPEVADYVKRKADDVDRWLAGMRRWQQRLFSGQSPPGEWLVS